MGEDATDTSDRPASRGGTGEEVGDAPTGGTDLDERAVDVLSWLLDTETRARIYVHLRQHPWSTSEEVAEGTGLYPSTVREALAALADDETLYRRKRQSEGAGNNPYEYTAIAPSELVGDVVGQVQDQLNAVCNLDRFLAGEERAARAEPVTIRVEDASDGEDGGDREDDGADIDAGDGATRSS